MDTDDESEWEEGAQLLRVAIVHLEQYMDLLPNEQTLSMLKDAYNMVRIHRHCAGIDNLGESFAFILQAAYDLSRFNTPEMQERMAENDAFIQKANEWYFEEAKFRISWMSPAEESSFLKKTEEVLDEAFYTPKANYLLEHSYELTPLLQAIEERLPEIAENDEEADNSNLLVRLRERMGTFLDQLIPPISILGSDSFTPLEYLVQRFAGDMAGKSVSPYHSWF